MVTVLWLSFDSDHAPLLQQAKQKIVPVDFTHAVPTKKCVMAGAINTCLCFHQ